jgi:hypothetical protein
MNKSIECHDSHVSSVRLLPGRVLIDFDPLYVMEEKRGWFQKGRIEIANGVVMGAIANGRERCLLFGQWSADD